MVRLRRTKTPQPTTIKIASAIDEGSGTAANAPSACRAQVPGGPGLRNGGEGGLLKW
jgi:hypothetical protein